MFELIAVMNWTPAVWAGLGIIGALGLLALFAPQRFAALTQHSSQWVDTEKILSSLDKKVDVDQYVLPHSRILGGLVLAGVATLAYLFVQYGS